MSNVYLWVCIIFIFNRFFEVKIHIFTRHHKCPHRPWGIMGKGDQPCAVTEYKNEFRGHDIEVRKPFKPDNAYLGTGVPLADETTHKQEKNLFL
jgi:hypothetical protein